VPRHSRNVHTSTSLDTWNFTESPIKNATIVAVIGGMLGGILNGHGGAKTRGRSGGVRTYYAKRTVCQDCAQELD
jgi:hypothetical protein